MLILDCDVMGRDAFPLPDGGSFELPIYRMRFDAATVRVHFDNDLYDIKPQVQLAGETLLGELLIVRLLERDGWDAVWIDNFKSLRWRGLPVFTEPVDEASTTFMDLEPTCSMRFSMQFFAARTGLPSVRR